MHAFRTCQRAVEFVTRNIHLFPTTIPFIDRLFSLLYENIVSIREIRYVFTTETAPSSREQETTVTRNCCLVYTMM